MTILISGGHLTPALAFIDYVQANHPEIKLLFVGRLFSKKGRTQKSQEKTEIEKKGIQFIAFDSGKMAADNFFDGIIQAVSFVKGLLHAITIMLTVRPTVFLSFGSYLAVPLGLAAWLCRTPVITHEQTETVGLANRILAYFAHTIAISNPHSRTFFPSKKVIVTGNLLRKDVLATNTTMPAWFTTRDPKPILYITGGSQGSELINTVVSQTIKQLLKNWTVIHQSGVPTIERNYRQELETVRAQLPRTQQSHYYILEWVSNEDLAWIYTHTHAAVSRAGANTTQELAARRIPTLFIPLPFSHHDEQLANAKALSDKKAALILLQKQVSPQKFLDAVQELARSHKMLKRNLTEIPIPDNSVEKLFAVVQAAQ